MVVDKKQVKLNVNVLKQKIHDDNDLWESVDMETAHKENKKNFLNRHEVDISLKSVG